MRKDTKIQEKEMRMGAATGKYEGGRGQEMRSSHPLTWGWGLCEVARSKVFVLRSTEALRVEGKGATQKRNSCK